MTEKEVIHKKRAFHFSALPFLRLFKVAVDLLAQVDGSSRTVP